MIRSLATPSMLLSDPSLIVMCDLGSRIARWGLDVSATLRARAEKWSK
jgi:hypothetical protein